MTKFEKAVQGQLEAYNARDIEGFMQWYAADVVAMDLDTDTILFSGKDNMRPRYAKKFENKYLYCELVNRMSLNRTVIDHERITNDESGKTFDAIAIYDIGLDGLISTIRFSKGKV